MYWLSGTHSSEDASWTTGMGPFFLPCPNSGTRTLETTSFRVEDEFYSIPQNNQQKGFGERLEEIMPFAKLDRYQKYEFLEKMPN